MTRLSRLAHALSELGGLAAIVVAAALGALAALAFAPVHAWPVLLVSLPGLIWLVDTRRTARAFWLGWWWGVGHFLAGLYWIANALLTDAERFGWLVAPALIGIAAGMALFPAASLWLARRLCGARTASPVAFAFALAASWTAFEWLRGQVLGGFPWNLMGYAWMANAALAQAGALVGVYGLSFLTVAATSLPAAIVRPAPLRRVQALRAAVAMIAVLALAWGHGAWRLASAEAAFWPDVRLRLVQANVAQHHKWRDDRREAYFERHLRLSRAPGHERVSHVIWPETATPYLLDRERARRRALASVAPPRGSVITGAVRAAAPGAAPQVWNSLQAVDAKGNLIATYDKTHLVPFGEYMPLRRLIGAAKITAGDLDFSAGPGPVRLTLPGLPPVSPLICYEAIFPAGVVAARARPDWLLNVTNDAWFGHSSGPHQHFAMARMRAIEQGLALVRAANTGISAVVDPYGRILGQLDLGREGVLDARLPRGLAPTLYARLGDTGTAVLIAAGLAVPLVRRRRHRVTSSETR